MSLLESSFSCYFLVDLFTPTDSILNQGPSNYCYVLLMERSLGEEWTSVYIWLSLCSLRNCHQHY